MANISINSEVAGIVFRLQKQIGEQVESGDTLLLLESMKMEIPVTSPVAGMLQQWLVAEGDQVAEDQTLALVQQ